MNIPIKLEKVRRTPKIQKYFGSGRSKIFYILLKN